jgi:nitrogen-specific signal transduction histidine kinase
MADHHGSIEVESQEGGTTFILKLPFQPVEPTLAERRDRNDAH